MIYSDMKDNINAFLKNYGIYLAIGVAALIVIAILLILLLGKKKKIPERQNIKIETSLWIDALGGKDNIIESNATGSRLSIKLNEPSLISEEKLKELGVSNIIKMSNKITLVVEDQAEAILKQLQ